MEHRSFRPDETETRAFYELLVSALAPRPVVFVGTLNEDGQPRYAPFSFIAPGGTQPPSLVLSITLNADGERKSTLRNIERVGEFVVQSIEQADLEKLLGGDAIEWETQASESIQVPRIAGAKFAFECRHVQTIEHGHLEGASRYVIAEIVVAHCLNEAFESDLLIPNRIPVVGRMGGRQYVSLPVGKMFELG